MTNEEKYDKVGHELIRKTQKKRDLIIKKYENIPKCKYGIDGDPEDRELAELDKWFAKELKKLQKKYHIETKYNK